MFAKTRGYFSTISTENSNLAAEAEDLRIAVASLLIAAARADSHLAESEYQMITGIIKDRLGFAENQMLELLQEKANLEPISQITEEIRNGFSSSQREQILALVWSVVSANNIPDSAESKFAVQLRTELDLSLEQSIRARKLSEDVKIDGFKEFVEASESVIAGTAAWVEEEADGVEK